MLSSHTPAPAAPASTAPLPLWKLWLPSLVILAAATGLALWALNMHNVERRAMFQQQAQRMQLGILDAMLDYESLLYGGAGLLSVTPELTRSQWENYVRQLGATRMAQGTRGIGYADHVPAAGLKEYLRSMPRRGLPGYSIRPKGARAEYCPIFMVAPADPRNLRVSGFDMYTSPQRREALERARDTGRAALSGRVILAGEGTESPQPGCVLFVPVYRQGMPTVGVAERRAALRGFVISPFRAGDLLRAILGRQLDQIGLDVYDGGIDPQDPSGSRLFSSRPQGGAQVRTLQLEVEIAGQRWVLVLSDHRPLEAWPVPPTVLLILLLGLLLAGAVHLIVRNIDATRGRSETLARQMTAELRRSETYNRAVFQHSSQPIGVGSPDGRVLDANLALLELLGYAREEFIGLLWQDLTHPEDREENGRLLREILDGARDGYMVEKRYLHKDGHQVWVQLSIGVVRDDDGQANYIIGAIKDISAHRAALAAERQRQVRRTALLRLHEMHQSPRQELLAFALDQTLLMTESPMGYLFSYDDTTRSFSIDALSPLARELCSGLELEDSYSLARAGLWGEAVRLRGPVLLNDFDAPHQSKRGLPEGHAPLTRFLSVPVMSSGRVLGVVAVANREAPYTEEDISQLRLFTDGLGAILERQAAEKELRAVSERFHLAVRAGHIGLWDWDLETGLMHCDTYMEELFGLQDSNRTGTPEDWLCRVHGEDRARVRQELEAALQAGGRFESSFRVLRPGGKLAHIEASAMAHLGPQGLPLRLVGVNIDATRLREAEQQLAQSHRFLQTLIDTLPHTFFCKDVEGRYLLVNQAFASMRGLPGPVDFVGRSVDDFEPPQLAALHQEWDRRVLEAGPGTTLSYEYARALASGGFEHRMIFKNLVSLPDGRQAIVGLNVDISDRKAMEEALREERRRLTDVIEGTNVGTWEWNIATGEIVCNQRWAGMLGYTLEELAPLSVQVWQDLTHPEDLALAWEALKRHFSGETDYYDCECRMRHKDGHWVWVHDQGRVFATAADGSPLRMSGTHADISERKLAEERISLVARFPVENPNPVLRVDSEGRMLYANPASTSLLKNWGQDMGGQLPAELQDEVRQALGTGQARDTERSYACGIYSITVSPFVEKGYANIYAVDITLRKRAELALRQSERRYRELAVLLRLMCDNVPDMIWAKDREHRYLFANKAVCEQFLGVSDTLAPLGLTDQDFVARHQAACPAEPSWTEIYDSCRESDQETLAGQGRGQYEESGHFQGQLRSFDVRKAPFVNDQGEVIGTVGSARDITKRKAAEAALAKSEERFRTLAQVSPVGIFQSDALGRCIYVNDQWAAISGFPKEAALGLRWMLTLSPRDRKAALRGFRATVRTGSDYQAEFRFRGPQGPGRWVLVRAAAERNARGEFVGIVGALTDITVLKEAEEALRQAKAEAEAATRAKAQFLANMSHEIRTPLAGVIGTTRLLAQTELDQEQQRLAEMALESGQALLSVLNDILDFSKIEAGQLPLRSAPFALRRFVQSVAAPSKALAEARGLALDVSVDPQVPEHLVGDEGRLGQVLRNLLSNACKFTEAGTVTLSVSQDWRTPDRVSLRLRVSDTGPGIAPDYLPRIFDSFSQADSSFGKQHGGTGLGLAICKSLVEQMGGRIEVESTPGAGSVFTVMVPLALVCRERKAAAPPTAAQDGAALRCAPLRVLLADDNAIGRMLVERVLQKAGHQVTLAEDGNEALEALRRERFDLVLMDVQMPGLDGLAATRLIRQGAAGAHNAGLAVVALTAYASPQDREQFLAAGMDEAVGKPAEEHMLFAGMERALAVARNRGAAAPQAPGTPAPAQRDQGPQPGALDIPRLDQDYIERAFRDDRELLSLMLRQFQGESLPDLQRELGQALAQEDSAAALSVGQGLVHRARGTLGSLGALRGARLAARAEKAALEGDAALFRLQVAALLEELAALAEHLSQGLPWGPQERQ